MKTRSRGFICCDFITLVGSLSAVGLPAYQDYTVRAKVSESVVVMRSVQELFEKHYTSDGIDGLNMVAKVLNEAPPDQKGSRYVANVCVGGADCAVGAGSPWQVHVVFQATRENGLPRSVDGKTLVFSPNVAGKVPEAGASGNLQWACASSTSYHAENQGLSHRVRGTLPAKYAPSVCR